MSKVRFHISIALEQVRAVDAPGVTHIEYRA
jgi:hypothetical protein